MPGSARRTEPEKWERVKRRVTEGHRGGGRGQRSARKAQLAVQEYRKAGGGYLGPRRVREEVSEAERARSTATKRKDTAAGRQFSRQPAGVARRAAKARGTGKQAAGGRGMRGARGAGSGTARLGEARRATAKPARRPAISAGQGSGAHVRGSTGGDRR
jgi:hypothetical protein